MGVFDWPEANAWGRLTEAWNADSSRGVRRGNAICGLETKARLPGRDGAASGFPLSKLPL